MSHPVEVAAVDDTSAHLCGHTIHILRGGVGDDVGSPFERTTVDGCGEGVVDDEGHTVTMGDFGELLDIEDGTARVRDSLAKQCLRIRTEGCLKLLLTGIGRYEGTVDTQLLHGHSEKVIGATVDLVRRHKVVACLTDIEQGIEIGCLS